MTRIRVGLIGLAAGGSWAAVAHLPYLTQSDKYEVVALCNSSVESAEASKKAHNLAASVKTYGSYKAIAADPDVDLVVCCVRVDRHFDALKPALQNGKDVFSEWPLAATVQQAEELTRLAQENGCKTLVGFQGRVSPIIRKVKQIVSSGRIGKVLSTSMAINTGPGFGESVSENFSYIGKREVGGNAVTIMTGHGLDVIQFALGEIASLQATFGTQYPETKILTNDGKPTGKVAPRDTPDHVFVNGKLDSGALASFSLRCADTFKGERDVVWSIYGTEGDIVVRTSGMGVHIPAPDCDIRVWDRKSSGEVETVDWRTNWEFEKLPMMAQTVGATYEAFATGATSGLVAFKDATSRHKLLDTAWKSSEDGVRVNL